MYRTLSSRYYFFAVNEKQEKVNYPREESVYLVLATVQIKSSKPKRFSNLQFPLHVSYAVYYDTEEPAAARRLYSSTVSCWRSGAALCIQGLPLTIVGAKPIFIGIVGWSHLDGWRCWEHQDVCTRSILRGVKLRWLHVQCSTSAKNRAHCDSILKRGEKCINAFCAAVNNSRNDPSWIDVSLTQLPWWIHIYSWAHLSKYFQETDSEQIAMITQATFHTGKVRKKLDWVNQICFNYLNKKYF